MLNKRGFFTPTRSKYWILGSSILVALLIASVSIFVSTEHSYEGPSVVPADIEAPAAAITETTSEPLLPVYFTGDVMLARYVETLVSRAQVRPFDFMRLFASSSAVVVNFESAMASPHVATPSGGMQFSTAPQSLSILSELGVTHASLANNHARDYGPLGYHNTVRELLSRSITPFGDAVRVGTTSLAYLPLGEQTLGILGLHTLFVTPSKEELELLMAQLAASSTVQIAYVHWGNEYELTHSRAQENFAELLVSLGVDMIIGHHPHVTQDISIIDGVPVFYSLGNFIFDQYFSPDVQEGLVVGLSLSKEEYIFTLHPHAQCARSTPCLMTDEAKARYLEGLAARSDGTLGDQIRAKKLVIPR